MDTPTAEKIPMIAVESSALSAIGYNPAKRILALKFKGGAVHHLADVSEVDHAHLMAAESIGRHFAQHLKGKYQSEKMTGPCGSCGAQGWIGDTCADCGCNTHQPVPAKDGD